MPHGKRSGAVTLAQVAERAGVSVVTASQILAETKGVRIAQATRERVRQAARELGYQPNRLARAMRQGKTNIISVWVPVDRPAMTFLRFLNSVRQAAHGSGHDLMIVGLSSDQAYGHEDPPMNLWPCDGIISYDAGRAIARLRKSTTAAQVPTVVIGAEDFECADTVFWDVVGASRELVADLAAQGIQRIVHVTPDWVAENYPKEQRQRGYREAMEQSGLEPEIIRVAGESTTEAAQAMSDYLKTHDPPGAVTAFTDTLALGAVRALSVYGVHIPGQCQVWGYGDYPEGADARIPLSTLRIPMDAMVEQGWAWLLDRLSNPQLPAREKGLPMERICRQTSR